MDLKKAEKLATEHWDWLETLLRKVYTDAFVHGWKHARQEQETQEKREDKQ